MYKDVKFVSQGGKNGDVLRFDLATGFAINPETGGNLFFSGDHRNLVLCGVGKGTVKLYGSIQRLPPTVAPSTIHNAYAPITLRDYSIPNTYYAGVAGFNPVGGVGQTMIVEADTNLLTWFAIHRDATGVAVIATLTNNQ